MKADEFQKLALDAELEVDFMNRTIQFATYFDWYSYHTYDSRRSEPGFPDVVFIGHGRVLFREFKRQKGILTPRQKVVIARLEACGADVDVWRPGDWEGKIVPCLGSGDMKNRIGTSSSPSQ